MRRWFGVSLVLLAIAPLRAVASDTPYDMIFVDSFDVTLCSNGCGITLAGMDYALFVNTGTTDITIDDLRAARFETRSSEPTIRLTPFINIPNEAIIGAVHPNEALGAAADHAMLTDLVRPGETLRDLSGMQFMAFQIDRFEPPDTTGGGDDSTGVHMDGENSYEGPVDFDIRMVLGGHEMNFRIHAEVHLGPHSIMFLTATRGTRQSAVRVGLTPVRKTTWGALKRVYR